MAFRIGFGFDVHRFAEGRECWLGGVKIDSPVGPDGHSDADVLIHAICDALLGAANLRDIGFHFPDTDPEYKGADSKKLLAKVASLLEDKGYKAVNIDSTICAEKPKVNPHIPAMQKVLATLTGLTEDDISIKATTNEKMGFIGREEGLAAYAVVLITKA